TSKRSGSIGYLEEPDGKREPARTESYNAGTFNIGGGFRGDERRPYANHPRRSKRRSGSTQGYNQPDDCQPSRHHAEKPGNGLAQVQPREVYTNAARSERPQRSVYSHPIGIGSSRQCPFR